MRASVSDRALKEVLDMYTTILCLFYSKVPLFPLSRIWSLTVTNYFKIQYPDLASSMDGEEESNICYDMGTKVLISYPVSHIVSYRWVKFLPIVLLGQGDNGNQPPDRQYRFKLLKHLWDHFLEMKLGIKIVSEAKINCDNQICTQLLHLSASNNSLTRTPFWLEIVQ